jgi:hypothetical protein
MGEGQNGLPTWKHLPDSQRRPEVRHDTHNAEGGWQHVWQSSGTPMDHRRQAGGKEKRRKAIRGRGLNMVNVG